MKIESGLKWVKFISHCLDARDWNSIYYRSEFVSLGCRSSVDFIPIAFSLKFIHINGLFEDAIQKNEDQ